MMSVEAALAIPVLSAQTNSAEQAARDGLIQLMQEHERPLYRYILARVQNPGVASDCVQDTFLRAYEHLLAGKTVNKQWVYRVAYNRAVDEFRRVRRLTTEADGLEAAPFEGPSEQRTTIQDVLNRLAPLDRDALYLFAVAGFKTEEIAALIGTTGAAIRQRLYRAREEFRRLYEAAT
jgi:RNA polymerase sigma-70 factor (ECF subfamily)